MEEVFEKLLQTDDFTLERIISEGHVTPAGQWLEQNTNEWVILLKGKAKLRFKDTKNIFLMKPGSYVYIPAKCLHRVDWTDPGQKTIWLALHFKQTPIAMLKHKAPGK
ncbi:MAG: cupin [Candidatus Omnitrophota bacterium]